jgi:hypothetical protein
MGESDIRDADSYEELKGYLPKELKDEQDRVENELDQLDRTIEMVSQLMETEKQKQRERPEVRSAISPNSWDPPILQGFDNAQEVVELAKRTRQQELRERKSLLQRVLGDWSAGRIALSGNAEPKQNRTAAERHTIAIGEWLLEHEEEHGNLPNFRGSKETFKDEATEEIGDKGESMSKGTVYRALSETGCWNDDPKQGDSSGLSEIIKRTMEFAERYSDSSQRSQPES